MPRTVLAFAYAYCILSTVHTTWMVKFVLNLLSNLSNGQQLQNLKKMKFGVVIDIINNKARYNRIDAKYGEMAFLKSYSR